MCTWEKREDQNGVKEEQHVVRDSAVGCRLDGFVCGKRRWSRDRGWLICTYMSEGLLCEARARCVQEGGALTLSAEDGLCRGREGRDAREEACGRCPILSFLEKAVACVRASEIATKY